MPIIFSSVPWLLNDLVDRSGLHGRSRSRLSGMAPLIGSRKCTLLVGQIVAG
jgi:hypothetical protein